MVLDQPENSFSKEVWEHNYKAPNEKTIEDTWLRLAKACGKRESSSLEWEIRFFDLLSDFKFIPGGRIIANLGVEGREKTTLYNCYVNTIQDNNIADCDSLAKIYDYLKQQALTLQSEGGLGINMDWMRPGGSYITGIGGRSPGICKFLELWDKSSEIITSGSSKVIGTKKEFEKTKIRKGAQLVSLSCWHPDIEDFITAKHASGNLTKFNMSVGVSNEFLNAVKDNKNWDLIFPDTSFKEYKTAWDGNITKWKELNYPVIVCKTIKARELWELIMQSTFNHNEPGILFLDNINKSNPLSYIENIVTSNPCGEIPMSGPSVCLLGSLNLVKFVTDNKFDFDKFKSFIPIAIRFLDNIIDISEAPLEGYTKNSKDTRRIGLGTLGLGSLHHVLNISYGSKESLKLIEAIYKTKCEEELLASSKLALEKGSFPKFNKNKYFHTEYWNNLPIDKNIKSIIEKNGMMRNSHHSMNAPNGNTSIMAEYVSGGIEPVFLNQYVRWSIVPESQYPKGMDIPKNELHETKHLKFIHKGKDKVLAGNYEGIDYEFDKHRGLIKGTTIEDYGFTVAKKIYGIEKATLLKDTTSLNINDHLEPLKIISKYINMNSSKTINVPNNYEYKDFKHLYMTAWEYGIKGITTYRAGTMSAVLEKKQQITEFQNALEQQFNEAGDSIIKNVLTLPNEFYAKGFIRKDHNKKKWYILLAFADKNYKKPFAVFVNTNCNETNEITEDFIKSMETLLSDNNIPKNLIEEQRKKYEHQKNVTKIARIVGMALRHNIRILDIIKLMDTYSTQVSSFIFHLQKVLSLYIPEGTKVKEEECPNCKQKKIIYREGCKMCINCSWGKC